MAGPCDDASFRGMLESRRFRHGAEVVTTRGLPGVDALRASARDLLDDPRIGWISITDSPGGGAMLPPDWLAGLVATDRPHRVVLHMTCKDMNRNGSESAAWRYAALGFDNVLALTGDCPTTGFGGRAEGVFDIDSVGLIALLGAMNEGLRVPNRRGELERLPATRFYIGCAVSPFKRHERELMPQYFKLLRKIAVGAEWVVPQLGYDMRKFYEVKLLLASRGLRTPVIGNVYLLTKTAATLFNQGKLAGCVVSDRLLATIEKYAGGADKGRGFCRELAAKQLAVFKGLGFAAGYIGGVSKPEIFGQIIDLAESFAPDDWRDFYREIQYSQEGEFFLFEHDECGPGDPARLNRSYVESLARPSRSRQVTWGFRFSRWVHRWFFTRDAGFWGLMRAAFARWDKRPGLSGHAVLSLERASKRLIYGCLECGDCSLPECAYLCPRSACSKQSRNGPCGGSRDGRCELGDKDCFWARVYERLKYFGESEHLTEASAVVYNAGLRRTSSWANVYLDRDHGAPKDSDEDPEGKKDSSPSR